MEQHYIVAEIARDVIYLMRMANPELEKKDPLWGAFAKAVDNLPERDNDVLEA